MSYINKIDQEMLELGEDFVLYRILQVDQALSDSIEYIPSPDVIRHFRLKLEQDDKLKKYLTAAAINSGLQVIRETITDLVKQAELKKIDLKEALEQAKALEELANTFSAQLEEIEKAMA